MKNSKSLSLILAFSACVGAADAQVSPSHPYTAPHPIYGSFSVTDDNYYNSKQLTQQKEFMVGNYDYPGKPKDMWEFGIKGGLFHINGDVASVLLSQGFGAHVRKSLGHTLSLRLEYMYGVARGQDWRPSGGYKYAGFANPWFYRYTRNSVLPGGNVWDPIDYPNVYYNYKTHVQELSLQLLANIHNIRFYKPQTGVTLYGLVGFGVSTWKGRVDAMYEVNGDAESAAYDFSTINSSGVYSNKKEILDQLKDLQNGEYDTPIETDPSKPWSNMFAGNIAPSISGGLGLAFRLSPRVNLAIEDRVIYNGSDLLDGQRWDEKGTLTPDKDFMNYFTVGLNFNIGNKSRRVEPLYWLNAANYAYGELRRVPEIVLPDADGDGVTDQFDQEQTPAGCPVDTHGVSRDTDGDGVPDCKDKELVTPTYCQPVDADGVGKCPCPEGCAPAQSDCAATLGALPSIHFASNSNKLSDDAAASLSTVASKLKANPNCKVVVVGYCAATKRQQQLSWDHVNKVISHLVENEGVSSDRFIFSSGQEGGDCDVVDIRAAAPGEDGPNTVAPPHPNLRKN
ncbi:OmpA family protein [Niabella insulamsoli]|uniref:OmpA family protein n=1 Tax=Niabella insulamsoli TaxID=3144874 RepID=UPI0031FD5EE3